MSGNPANDYMFIVLLLLVASGGQAALWDEKSLKESIAMRQCLNLTHASLFGELTQYMRDIPTRKVLESMAIHALTGHLRAGQRFCRALTHVGRLIYHDLEYRLATRKTDDDGVASGLKPTYDFLRNRDTERICEERLVGKHEPTGPLSTVVACLTGRRKLAVAHMVTSRFAEDEARSQ